MPLLMPCVVNWWIYMNYYTFKNAKLHLARFLYFGTKTEQKDYMFNFEGGKRQLIVGYICFLSRCHMTSQLSASDRLLISLLIY